MATLRKWKKRWVPDKPVNAFRLPRSETKADAITKKKQRRKETTSYQVHVRKSKSCREGERKREGCGFLNKNLVGLEQGGPR